MTAWLLVMFIDAGAHFMQSTTGLVRVQTVETDELTDTFQRLLL